MGTLYLDCHIVKPKMVALRLYVYMEHCFFRVAQAITFKINHFQLYKTKQPKYPVNLTVREQDDSEQACISANRYIHVGFVI